MLQFRRTQVVSIPLYLKDKKAWELAVSQENTKVEAAQKTLDKLMYMAHRAKNSETKPKTSAQKKTKLVVPKKVVWVLPVKEEENDVLDNEMEIVETPEIAAARQNLEVAKNAYAEVLEHETQLRDNLSPVDLATEKYWSYVRQDVAGDQVQAAEEALEKLVFTQKIKP